MEYIVETITFTLPGASQPTVITKQQQIGSGPIETALQIASSLGLKEGLSGTWSIGIQTLPATTPKVATPNG